MCSIAANNCDMRQHRKEVTSSITADGSLNLRYKDDSIYFTPLTAAKWLNIYVHLKIFFSGISSSHLPVTQENIVVKKIREWIDDNKWKIHFPNWDAYFFSAAINEKSFTSICFRPIYTSLGRSQSYFY